MLIRNVGGGLAAAAMLVSALAATPAIAQPAQPRSFAPRMFSDQQTTFLRFAVNFNSCSVPIAGSCSFRVGAVPYNAFMVRGYMQVYTAFNSTTTDTVAIGTGNVASGNSANLVAATSTHAAGNAAALTIVPTGLGLGNTAGGQPGVTGNGAVQSGGNGGFEIYVTLASTGAAAPTAGNAAVILEYIAPNDGACSTNIPQGATTLPPC